MRSAVWVLAAASLCGCASPAAEPEVTIAVMGTIDAPSGVPASSVTLTFTFQSPRWDGPMTRITGWDGTPMSEVVVQLPGDPITGVTVEESYVATTGHCVFASGAVMAQFTPGMTAPTSVTLSAVPVVCH